jgi:uncharacterized protein YjbI with pentapeptide repeats
MGKVMGKSQARVALEAIAMTAFDRLSRFSRTVTERGLPVWNLTVTRFERAWQRLKRNRRAAFWAAGVNIALVLLIGFAIGGGASWMWGRYRANREDITPIATFLGAGVAAWVALRQVRIALKQADTASRRHEEQTIADRQRRITESYSKAIEQLGSDRVEERLGGIYSLERISKESSDDYWTVMETLTAFVRERTRRAEVERTSQPFQKRVSERAYFLWLDSGKPEGQAGHLWTEAVEQEEYGEPPAIDINAVITVMMRRTEQSRARERANDWCLDFRGSVLKQANLSYAHLEYADFRDAHLEAASLNWAHLEHANFEQAHLKMASLHMAHLEYADFTNADLERATLSEAYLEHAVFFFTNLRGAQLRWAQLEGAALFGAHFETARLAGAHLERTRIVANLEGADLFRAHLEDANFIDADLEGANFAEAHLEHADLSEANGLSEAQLLQAFGDTATKLPRGIARPAHWLSAEAPGDRMPPEPDA